jgi:methoxymalonate biosynthesis acyl carrier protein
MDIAKEIISYIAEIGEIPREDIHVGVKVYNLGIISSLKLIELMTYIEKKYSIMIKPEELIVDNFRDIGTIVDFIRSKQKEEQWSFP